MALDQIFRPPQGSALLPAGRRHGAPLPRFPREGSRPRSGERGAGLTWDGAGWGQAGGTLTKNKTDPLPFDPVSFGPDGHTSSR